MADPRPFVIVVGAGVLGLTTAVRLQKSSRFQVALVGEVLPSDPINIRWTTGLTNSIFVHSNHQEDQWMHRVEQESFDHLWAMSEPQSDSAYCFTCYQHQEYRSLPIQPNRTLPLFASLSSAQDTQSLGIGCSFQTLCVDYEKYLAFLLQDFLMDGGQVIRGSIRHIDQVIEGGTAIFHEGTRHGRESRTPSAVIVCTGFGSRFMAGVEDRDVCPVRREALVLKAPWITTGVSVERADMSIWIAPRNDGQVIVAGNPTFNDWFPKHHTSTRTTLLPLAVELCPDLVPLIARDASQERRNESIRSLIVSEGCDIFDSRAGGPRLESTLRGSTRLVFNYGHGAYALQRSWGCALQVERYLTEPIR
ncbi:D-amino-acid oxidase [Coprinellus micaceus]|uniref:D-amino-acid oxidase n=1 Tax=Coprinellus micaceus TaxID=71717 RepID=A0A4Y7SLN5_COPMI|nr:D-amino-acid oxidase [Coprinellus micaceus]